jgi:predicted negative regulator of RcsB-dependent stress response
MKRHPYLILLALFVIGVGGNVAWQAYEDHQRAAAFETLLDGVDCSTCSARKASVADKAAKRKAERAALENSEAVVEPSLIETLESDPPVDLSGHTEAATTE